MIVQSTPRQRPSLRELARQASAEPLYATSHAALVDAALDGDEEAHERLMRPLVRVVIDEAVAHRGGDKPLEVLVEAGLDGLRDALHTFDPSVGSFEGHARRAVRAGIRAVLLLH